jgi:acetylglutamate kinase
MKISDLPGKQAELYLDAFKAFAPQRQLLIKVGGGLLQDQAAVMELAEALAELADNDIHTLLVHGGGPQVSAAITEQLHSEPRFIDGRRYTDKPTLEIAEPIFDKISSDLVQAFQDNGIKAMALASKQVFGAKRDPTLGLVTTEITSIQTETIINAIKDHSVLLFNPLSHDETTGETLNVNADTIFRALATELQPHRMTNLTPTGGVLKPIDGSDDTQEIIGGIDIRDVETLIAEGIVSGGMAFKLRELVTILDKLESGSAISITKPADLLLELLTYQGSGTFVGKGPKILTTDKIADVLPDLSTLIEEVFDKDQPEGYADRPFKKIYYTADHLAFGIVTTLADGTAYLDKLAVSPQLQGRGIGESLWYRVTRDFPVILWRSHVTNRYATWYHRHADIMKRHGEWILFAHGVDFEKLEATAQELVDIPAMR